MSQCESAGDSNTKTGIPRKKYARWDFTYNNYTRESIESLKLKLRDYKYAFQEEIAPTTGTPHLQGYIDFGKRVYKSYCIKICDKASFRPERNHEALLKYVSDMKKRSGNYYTNLEDEKIFISPLHYDMLYPWQKEIEDLINTEPHDRHIYWYWEPTGNVGKTEFIKYLLTKYSKCEFSRACKSADILTVASVSKSVYLFDFARSQDGFAPWNAIEQLKDGLISDSKLKKKSNNIIIPRPHIICFANWEPNVQLSEDKLVIKQIIN